MDKLTIWHRISWLCFILTTISVITLIIIAIKSIITHEEFSANSLEYYIFLVSLIQMIIGGLFCQTYFHFYKICITDQHNDEEMQV